MFNVDTMTPCLVCGEPIPTGWPCPCGTPERAGYVEARRPGDGTRRRRVDRKRNRAAARWVIQAARRAHAVELVRGAA